MKDNLHLIGGSFLGWQIGNLISDRPIDNGMVLAGVVLTVAGLILYAIKSRARP
jgi:hypothetical protein